MAKTTKFEIKHRFNGDVLFAAKTTDQREAILSAIDSSANLSSADLSFADLSFADLRHADLRYADLRSADLSYADLSGVKGLLEAGRWIIENLV